MNKDGIAAVLLLFQFFIIHKILHRVSNRHPSKVNFVIIYYYKENN